MDTLQKKTEQITAVTNRQQLDDDIIINPKPIMFTLGNKQYPILPIPMSKRRVLIDIQALDTSLQNTHASMDKLIQLVGLLLGETDLEFINNNLTAPGITHLCKIIQDQDLQGIRMVMGLDKKKEVTEKQ